jgi:squalene synthase HpnC
MQALETMGHRGHRPEIMRNNATTAADISSGKDVAYENFPVGSWLLPARLRPPIAIFYAFARATDDVADSPMLSATEKIDRLNGYERALLGGEQDDETYAKAHAMRRSLAETKTSARHCVDLLAAFKQDATKLRYKNWAELIGYCQLSAAPVGRYLIDLHGGAEDNYVSSDALCIALQILNHLQDVRADYLDLDRVYLPTGWFAEEGSNVTELRAHQSSPAMRRILDRALDGVDELLETAGAVGTAIVNTRLAMEAEVIYAIARTLAAKLRRHDPLGPRVVLSRGQYVRCGVAGVARAVFHR